MKDLLKTWVASNNPLKISDQKRPLLEWRTKQRKQETLKAKSEHGPCNNEEKN